MSRATSYSICQGAASGAELATPVYPGTTHSVAITDPARGGTRYFKINASSGGTSPRSAEVGPTPQ